MNLSLVSELSYDLPRAGDCSCQLRLIPLGQQFGCLAGVARTAGRHQVVFGFVSSACQRRDVVRCGCRCSAVDARSGRNYRGVGAGRHRPGYPGSEFPGAAGVVVHCSASGLLEQEHEACPRDRLESVASARVGPEVGGIVESVASSARLQAGWSCLPAVQSSGLPGLRVPAAARQDAAVWFQCVPDSRVELAAVTGQLSAMGTGAVRPVDPDLIVYDGAFAEPLSDFWLVPGVPHLPYTQVREAN